MNPVQKLHHLLISTRLTRSLQRRVVLGLKRRLGAPDAYDDLAALIADDAVTTVIDIGAHVGRTANRLRERTDKPILALEATLGTYEKLVKNVADLPSVTPYHVAITDRDGTIRLQINANEQTNSVLANADGNRDFLADATRTIGLQSVPASTLDTFVDEVGIVGEMVVKCDVQGAEGLVLAGGERTFPDRVAAFYAEAQISSMYDGQTDFFGLHRRMVEQYDFALANIYPVYRSASGRALQTDALWIANRVLRKMECESKND